MKSSIGALACALCLLPASAYAQTAAPTVAAIAPPATSGAVLRVGTKVPLKLAETLTTKGKQLRVGQRFQLEVAEAVLVDGQMVIPAGTPGVGEITDVRNKGMWGKSGHLSARVLYVTVNGRQVRMTGAFDDKGTAGTAAVVGAVVLLPIAGFLMTGTSAMLPLGAPVAGFVDEDVPLNFAAIAPAPLTVGTPVALPATAPVMTPAAMNVAH